MSGNMDKQQVCYCTDSEITGIHFKNDHPKRKCLDDCGDLTVNLDPQICDDCLE